MASLCTEILARAGTICPAIHSCHFSWPPFCIFIGGVISLACTQGNQGDNLKCSSVPVFILATVWGCVLGSRAREPGSAGCVHTWYMWLRCRKESEGDDLPSLHVRMCSHDDSIQEMFHCNVQGGRRTAPKIQSGVSPFIAAILCFMYGP